MFSISKTAGQAPLRWFVPPGNAVLAVIAGLFGCCPVTGIVDPMTA